MVDEISLVNKALRLSKTILENETAETFTEGKHPRGDGGKWAEASSAYGEQLRMPEPTRPEDADMLSGDYHAREEKRIWATLSPLEKDSVRKWVSSSKFYRDVQSDLRDPISKLSPDPEINRGIAALKQVIEKSPPLPQGTVLYRGLRGSGEMLGKLQSGESYTDEGFTATSPDKDQATLFATKYNTGANTYVSGNLLVKIIVKEGTKAFPVGGNSNEGQPSYVHDALEMILAPGFRGTIVERDGSVSPAMITVRQE